MDYTIGWHNAEHTILHIEVRGTWTWAEARQLVQEQYRWMDESPHTVHAIWKLRVGEQMPPGSAVRGFKQLLELAHPNDGAIVFVGGNIHLQTIVGVLARVAPLQRITQRLRFAANTGDALSIIDQYVRQRGAPQG
jgi:hypothetical protein